MELEIEERFGDRDVLGESTKDRAMELPVACELDDEQRRSREAEIRRLITSGATEIERAGEGLTLRFDGSPDWVDLIAELVKIERGCCRFLQFRMEAQAGLGPISLEISGPKGTGQFLRSWVDESAPDGGAIG